MHQHFGEWVLFFQIIAKNVCVLGTKGLKVFLPRELSRVNLMMGQRTQSRESSSNLTT